MKLPPLAHDVAQRMLRSLDDAPRLTPGDLKKYELLKAGNPGPIAERVAELDAKRALTPPELKELKELKDALAELKSSGWQPGKKSAATQGVGSVIDRLQSGLDVMTTTARMFEDLLYKKLKADPALAKDPNAFQEAYSLALGKLKRLDTLRPANGQLTQVGAHDAAKRFADAAAELKGLPVAPGSAHAQMISALEKSGDAVKALADSWKAGLKTIQLSPPRGPIFDWLR